MKPTLCLEHTVAAEMPENFDISVSEVRTWARQLRAATEKLDPNSETDVNKFKFYTTCAMLLFTFADQIEECGDEDGEDPEVSVTLDKKLN